jgi:hypothetical protein
MAKAECDASVKAEASLKAECTPPSVKLAYSLAANGSASANATAQAEFDARMKAFASAYGKLVAQGAKLDLVLKAGQGISTAATGAITTGIKNFAKGSGGIAAKFQVACLLTDGALDEASGKITASVTKVEGSISAVADITTAVSST